uniref:Uncharacterized protein n=1 Tax=Leersia perrieri TaxID=77586 RepID=A0A0D9XHW7_9ORYZ
MESGCQASATDKPLEEGQNKCKSHQDISNPLVDCLAVCLAGAAASVGRHVHGLCRRHLPARCRRENDGEHEQEKHQRMRT